MPLTRSNDACTSHDLPTTRRIHPNSGRGHPFHAQPKPDRFARITLFSRREFFLPLSFSRARVLPFVVVPCIRHTFLQIKKFRIVRIHILADLINLILKEDSSEFLLIPSKRRGSILIPSAWKIQGACSLPSDRGGRRKLGATSPTSVKATV